MPAPIDWERAERIATKIAARPPAVTKGSIHSSQFVDVARLAEDRVEETTGLRSQFGHATIEVIDRPDWIRANVAAFRSLLDPLLAKWGESAGTRSAFRTASAITRPIAAVEIGVMLGWMSTRVLGQYDLLVADATGEAEGAVYLVGPNIVTIENKFGFDREEFRLWVTLHELTHRAQFTGVPWMRQHFLDLMHRTLELADPDPARILAALRDAVRDRDAAKQRLRDGGIVAMVSTPEQQAVFNEIAGLMSLLEGHGDVVMDRAGADLIPSAERFGRVLRERRRRVNPLAKVIQRLVGLEGKLNQYEAGERFLAAIEAAGGEHAVDRCWELAANLPSLDEIRSPQTWLDRVGLERTIA